MIKHDKKLGSFTLEVAFLMPLVLLVLVFCAFLATAISDSYRLHEETNVLGKELANQITWFVVTDYHLDDDSKAIGESFYGSFRKSALEDYIQRRLSATISSNKIIESEISWEENVLFIFQKTSMFKVHWDTLPNLHYEKTYIFACPGVQDYFKTELMRNRYVMITQHGKDKTHVYHTHECWALKNAKTTERIKWPQEFDWQGKWMQWEGTKYTLCKVCAQDWVENQID
jgi:hypothetical protein